MGKRFLCNYVPHLIYEKLIYKSIEYRIDLARMAPNFIDADP